MSHKHCADWNYPTSVRFGAGRVSELAEACALAGVRRPLLVTDSGLAGTEMVLRAIAANSSAGVPTGLFTGVQSNPSLRNVLDGLRIFGEGDHDGLIGFGGGSAIDVAKAIAFMAPQTESLWDLEAGREQMAVSDGIAPIIAVPTTAGTGSEVTCDTAIVDELSHTKRIISHPRMMPAVAILDPDLTLGMPPKLTAATGMEALTHNLEAYCAPGFHPLSDGIAVEGLRLIREWLPVAYHDGMNLEARTNMLAAAAMGATACQKGLGAVHSLSHPISALYNTQHGIANGLFLPYVLAFNRKAVDSRIARLAAFMGLPEHSFVGFYSWLTELRAGLGVPHSLAEIGIGDDRFEELAKMAETDSSASTNPIPLSAGNCLALYRAAARG